MSLEDVARTTPGFSGAELTNMLNQAALRASESGADVVRGEHLEYAKDRIMMGQERSLSSMSNSTLRTTALHESGHALVALFTPGADPIHKATVLPRGSALGMVSQLPSMDDGESYLISLKQMMARLDVCFGGRAAEEIVNGRENTTSGVASDLQHATAIARAVVTRYGWSPSLGLGAYTDTSVLSPKTQARIDAEVQRLLSESYERVCALLTRHKSTLMALSQQLLETETMSGGDISLFVKSIDPQ